MRTVLVTGANGFVGSHLTEHLLRRGWSVRCLVRRTSDLQWLPRDGVELVYGEITLPETLPAALEGADVVVHAAGLVRAPSVAEYDRVNAGGTAALARAAAEKSVPPRRIVLVSSLAAGGASRPGRPRDESTPDRPLSDYGASKRRGEEALKREAGKVPWTIVRPSAVYGPRDRGLLVLARLAARGYVPPIPARRQPVNVIHVEDLVGGIAAAAESPRAAGKTYYLAHPRETSWEEMGRILARAVGKNPRRLPVPLGMLPWLERTGRFLARLAGKEDPLPADRVRELLAPAWTCDVGRAREELDFAPRVDLEEGLTETMRWYREAGWL